MNAFSVKDLHCKILSFVSFRQLCAVCRLVSRLWCDHASDDRCVETVDIKTCYNYISRIHSKQFKFGCENIKSNISLRKLSMNGFGSHAKTFICDFADFLQCYRRMYPQFTDSSLLNHLNGNTTLIKIASQWQYFDHIQSFTLILPRTQFQHYFLKMIMPLLAIISANSTKLTHLCINANDQAITHRYQTHINKNHNIYT